MCENSNIDYISVLGELDPHTHPETSGSGLTSATSISRGSTRSSRSSRTTSTGHTLIGEGGRRRGRGMRRRSSPQSVLLTCVVHETLTRGPALPSDPGMPRLPGAPCSRHREVSARLSCLCGTKRRGGRWGWYSLWLHGHQLVQWHRAHRWVLSCPPHPEVRGLPEVRSYPEASNTEVSPSRRVHRFQPIQTVKRSTDGMNLQALPWGQHLPSHPELRDLPADQDQRTRSH